MMSAFASWDGTLPWPQFGNDAAWWLFLLIVVPFVFWWRAAHRRRQVLQLWLGTHTGQFASPRRWLGRSLLILVILGLITALAKPEWGTTSITPTHEARDVLLLADVSQSMLAEDRPPTSRLQRAARAIEQFLEYQQQRRERIRIGIGVFAGNARILCPPTEDLEHVRKVVREMGPNSFGPLGRLPESDAQPIGTSFRNVIALAADWLKKNPEDGPFIDCLLISDGDDVGGDIAAAIKSAQEANLTVHVLGVGESERDWPIPMKNGYLTTSNPETGTQERVLTRRHDESLRQLSSQTSGKLILEETQPEPIVSWWNEEVAGKPSRALESMTRQMPVYQTAWVLLIVLVVLLQEVAFGGTRSRE